MKNFVTLLLAACSLTATAQNADVEVQQGQFEPQWESLAGWECPEWFKDAKFGIWAHWGPQCQAEDGDWYARFMYYQGSGQYNWHVNHFGNPSEYGLKELCRDWIADQWNPQELVALYKSVGARYFMTLGNHHDNFDLWNSPYQEWNSVNIGPKKDIVKGWREACQEQGLPFGVSMHASHAWTWLEPSQSFDGNLTRADGVGKWWEGYDPQELYAQNHAHSTGWSSSGTIHSQWAWGNGASLPSEAYKRKFQNRVLQCVNDYQPDMLYFDDTVLPFYGCDESVGLNILQHYYNTSAAQHDGKQQVVVMGKILEDMHKEALLWDVERGIPDRPQQKYWQTCTCIGDWHYNINNTNYKSAEMVISMLIDIVSKNGNLLLSVPVRGNGTIDQNERNVLAGIKAWMDINSESIYGTRTWKTFGEGPLAEAANPMTAQGFNEGQSYSSKDVRYVERNDTVYATIMRWPSAGDFTFKAFSIAEASYSGEVDKVELLGYGAVDFRQDISGLTVGVPATKPNNIAPVFRVTFKQDNRSAYEVLQSMTADLETYANQLTTQTHPYNTGKVNPDKLATLQTALETAKAVPVGSSDGVYEAARETLAEAYRTFEENGVNQGGSFSGVIDENLTTKYLVEGSAFTRSAGGNSRFGAPANWTVENFNIPNGGDGTKHGLDKYSGNEALMLGVWNDASKNTEGDLSNARIYRKVTMPAGRYYFGAAYNAAYQLSPEAFMFVSKQLGNTADIPTTAIAYYGLNKCSNNLKVEGLFFELEEETDLFIGFQANLLNGSATQEFRAERVLLYSTKEVGERHAEYKGWQQLTAMPDDVSQYFYAIYDHNTDNALVLDAGNNQGAANKTMWYQSNVFPEGNANALWTMDGFSTDNHSGATGNNAAYVVITGLGDPDNCLQHDNAWNFRTGNNGEGWTDRCYVVPSYLPDGYWTLKNTNGDAYIGHWDDTDEVAGNTSGSRMGRYDFWAIQRGRYVAAVEPIDKASEDEPIDISYVITNADATRYNNFYSKQSVGWTLSQNDAFECEYSSYLPTKVGSSYFNKWQSSGNLSNRTISQTVTGLPNGTYRLSVRTASSVIHAGAWLFANSDKTDMTTVGSDGIVSVTTTIADGTLNLGVELKNYTSNDCKFDHFTLQLLSSDELPTGIAVNEIANANSRTSTVYDLLGRRLARLQKGINIVNGRKVIK